MLYRSLGRTNLKVSVICLGTMMFGDRTDLAEAKNIVGSALDAGVNFIDTADVYMAGASETMVGQLVRENRARWILATKVGNPMGKLPNEGGFSRTWMMRAVEASLARLQTDYIDLYYLHYDNLKFPLETTIATIGDLIAGGRIRHFGVSNFRGWRIAEVVRICDALGVEVGSSRVDLQACKLEYSIVSPK